MRISGMPDLSVDTVSAMVGTKVPDTHGLNEEDWVTFVLYFVVTRRLFESKPLSQRDKMVIKVLQDIHSNMIKKLTITEDIHWIWNNT